MDSILLVFLGAAAALVLRKLAVPKYRMSIPAKAPDDGDLEVEEGALVTITFEVAKTTVIPRGTQKQVPLRIRPGGGGKLIKDKEAHDKELREKASPVFS